MGTRLVSRAMIGLLSVGVLATLGFVGPADSAGNAPSIVHNQSNLATSPLDSPQIVLAAAKGVPEGWIRASGEWTKSKLETCKGRGRTLVDLGIAATYGCFWNSTTSRYELWYSRACLDIVAPDPNAI